MVLFGCFHLFNLSGDAIIIGRSLHVADDTQSDRESVAIAHQSKLQLQGIILAVSIVNEDILLGDAVFTNLNDFQSESFLNKAVFTILTEDERLAMFYIDGVLCATFFGVNAVVGTVIEDDTVL